RDDFVLDTPTRHSPEFASFPTYRGHDEVAELPPSRRPLRDVASNRAAGAVRLRPRDDHVRESMSAHDCCDIFGDRSVDERVVRGPVVPVSRMRGSKIAAGARAVKDQKADSCVW